MRITTMIKQQLYRHIKAILFISSLCLLSGILLWSLTSPTIESNSSTPKESLWDIGWTQILDNESISLDSPSDFQEIPVGDTLVITNTIPEISTDITLFFYSKDLEITVYLGSEIIYSLEMQEGFELLGSPGHLWNEIAIPHEYSGETITIELTSQFSNRFMATLTKLYLIETPLTIFMLMKEEFFRLIMSVVILLMTIFAYVNSTIWKRKEIKKFYLTLGNFYLCITMWLLSMLGIFNYVLDNPVTNLVICNVMVLIIPIAVYEFFQSFYTKQNKLLLTLGILVWSNFFLEILLQFVFGISLLSLLPLAFVVYTLGTLGVLIIIIQHICHFMKAHRNLTEADFAIMSSIIFFIGILAEILVLHLFPKRTDLIGVSGLIGLSLYMVLNHIALTRFKSITEAKNRTLENNYRQLKNVTLVQQIHAHFIYNTLNNISALCKYDPIEADHAIIRFSKYMHSYMYLINEKENIPITQEVDLLTVSLEIELSRFPDSFTYYVDLEYTDFKIPPLSLQPLVENALYHGLRKSSKHGELKILSRKYSNMVQIIISDNGVGFDTSLLDNNGSIGFHNIKKRIALMANGTVNIESKIDVGTMVIIELPLT